MAEPITPPPELVQQWMTEIWHEGTPVRVAASDLHIATQSARWGADQELEACREYIAGPGKWFANPQFRLDELRDARRPKPPSLKEQALELVETYTTPSGRCGARLTPEQCDIIRRALESLDD